MRLLIVRHGETIDNVNKISQGHTPGKLTENGVNQAKKLGLRLKNTKIDAVYSSDLKRAVDTANEIVGYHPHLKLNLDQRIRERNMGPYEGKPYVNPKPEVMPDTIESNEAIFSRVQDFLDDILHKHKNETVLVVCHGGTKKAFLTIIHDQDISEYSNWPGIKNTSLSDFTISEDGNHQVHIINCTSHLD